VSNLSAKKLVLGASLLVLSACGGGGGSEPARPGQGGSGTSPPPITKTASLLETEAEAANFLAMAGFGSSFEQQKSLVDIDASNWVAAQFKKSITNYLPPLQSRHENGEELENWEHRAAFWDAMVEANDPLRQRVVFALSQILVASDEAMGNEPLAMAYYMDTLSDNAFGNYRDLLQEITYSPAMARYLTYLRNKKGDPKTGRMPDENYAREVMQLFTIGLVELNMDGTPKRDGSGQSIETYTNEDIVGLARVFTGLAYRGGGFWDEAANARYTPLVPYAERHSELEKTFLGKTIPAGTDADSSIDQALDHIFEHPNVAPFVSRQLIQRFTTSHPDPAYVERVATAFENGRFTAPNDTVFGTGQRGDMQATIAAILLDQTVLPRAAKTNETGKIREPILRWVHWARAFEVANVDAANEWSLLYSDTSKRLSQRPFGSPSVFNFYRPGYMAPGSETGAQNLTAPEFQIVHEGAAIGYANFMTDFALDRSSRRSDAVNTFAPNYTRELEMADDPDALINHLDGLLLAGRMSSQTRDRIKLVLEAILMTQLDRRNFLSLTGAAGLLGLTGAITGLSTRANAASVGGYKALVCVFLEGGMDQADTVLPYDQTSHDALREIREGLFNSYNVGSGQSSRDLENLLQLNPQNAGDFGSRKFALPQELSPIKSLFDNGNAAIVGNVR